VLQPTVQLWCRSALPWTLGRRYKLVNVLAIAFVILVVYSLNLPYSPGSLPWNDDWDVSLVNYTPLAVVLPLIFGVWYLVSAKNRYQGPVRTLEEDEVTADRPAETPVGPGPAPAP
jgi:hypothetical protein